jgi:hypothetical protein
MTLDLYRRQLSRSKMPKAIRRPRVAKGNAEAGGAASIYSQISQWEMHYRVTNGRLWGRFVGVRRVLVVDPVPLHE